MSTNPIFNNMFHTVERAGAKASILIEGLSGRGKSGLALQLGYYLADKDWTKVFDIDTENNSVNLYDGLQCSAGMKFENFQHCNFTPDLKYKPSHYEAIKESAIQSGAEVVINDSISHAWSYEGGVLDRLAELKKGNKRYEKDSYAAWGDEEIVSEKQKLMQLLRDSRCHMIATVRVKEKLEYDKDANGKTVLVSLGDQEIMQADMKYEPDLVLHMESPGYADEKEVHHPKARVVKSRYAILKKDEVYEFTPTLCEDIADYLKKGTAPEEILEKQRQEYIKEITEYLDTHQNMVAVWQVYKDDEGVKNVPIEDMSLDVLKRGLIKMTID